jgi:hypothetical protein
MISVLFHVIIFELTMGSNTAHYNSLLFFSPHAGPVACYMFLFVDARAWRGALVRYVEVSTKVACGQLFGVVENG